MAFFNKISKTRFMAGLNCPRFFPLFELYKKKNDATVSFKDDLSDLLDEENLFRKQELINEMFEVSDEDEIIDKIESVDPSHEIMMPYYRKIEELSSIYAKHKFNHDVIFSFETKEQKRFETEVDGYYFYCFLDGYQDLGDTVNIIESKAITSNTFFKQKFSIDKEKYAIFQPDQSGILRTRESLGLPIGGNYKEVIERIIDRNHELGSYIYDLTYQRFVIENSKQLNHKNVRYLLSVLNHTYEFDGVYENKEPNYLKDIDKNFIITLVDVTDLTEIALKKFKEDLKIVINRLDTNYYDDSLNDLCPRKGKHKCMFHDICYEKIPKENSIFTYLYGHFGFKDEKGNKHFVADLLRENKLSVLDIPYHWLDRPINRIQYNAVKTHKPYINYARINEILSKLPYPLYHLDFESFPCPLPRFKGEKPYSQSVFQFNLHIEEKNKDVHLIKDSYHYLATDHTDHRKSLVEYMLKLIKDDGTIIAWNDNFEKARLKEFANFFPEYKEKLINMVERTFDLMAVFKGNYHEIYPKWGIEKKEGVNFYHEKMQGSFSIKKVLPILVPSMNYNELDVKNGNDAMVTYAMFPYMENKEFVAKKDALITYCRQDTFAMVKILSSLRKIAEFF
ncbi:DUF2779 domain-containing protein [Acholeplasma hippikon]|nr:DUF2779 domain-containing protein [Acholeplasma hippikon]